MMKDSHLRLRKASPDDSQNIEILHRKTFSQEVISRSIFSSPDISRYIFNLIAETSYRQHYEENLFFVAYLGEAFVGYLQAKVFPSTLHINYIAVAPEYQGKGIGKSLFNYFQNSIGHLDLEKLTIDVDYSNKIALQWYHNLGFIQKTKTYVYCKSIKIFKYKPCIFKVSNWLNAEAWQYAFGFSQFILEVKGLQDLKIGRIGQNYWRIDEAEALNSPELIYALKNIDGSRGDLLISSQSLLSFINTEPKEIIYRMEKFLK